jgi:hypothetical protein
MLLVRAYCDGKVIVILAPAGTGEVSHGAAVP